MKRKSDTQPKIIFGIDAANKIDNFSFTVSLYSSNAFRLCKFVTAEPIDPLQTRLQQLQLQWNRALNSYCLDNPVWP